MSAATQEPTRINPGDIRNAIEDTVGDGEQGKLVEVPRIATTIDETDPSIIKLAFSGGIELDRADRKQVEFYNSLTAGKDRSLKVDVFVAGPKNSHRRDSEGNVDAVVQTKSVLVTDVHFA